MKENKKSQQIGYDISYAEKSDINEWMKLVDVVKNDFPGLIKEEYEKILLDNIESKTALCAKVKDKIIGVLLFSVKENILSFLAVHPEYRGIGTATALISNMVKKFPKTVIYGLPLTEKEIPKEKPPEFYIKNAVLKKVN